MPGAFLSEKSKPSASAGGLVRGDQGDGGALPAGPLATTEHCQAETLAALEVLPGEKSDGDKLLRPLSVHPDILEIYPDWRRVESSKPTDLEPFRFLQLETLPSDCDQCDSHWVAWNTPW